MMNKNEKNTRKDDVLDKLSFGTDDGAAVSGDLQGSDSSLGFDMPSEKKSSKK